MSTERKDVDSRSERLEALRGREYWRSLEELLETDDFREHLHREFRVPIDSHIDRRELLTLMGASMALAGLTGCVRQPTERIFPYVQAPEEMVPGEPLYYATAHLHGGYARGIVVESYEGRPTKIEGNELHPTSKGGTDVFAQGSILNMYDPDRSQTLTERGEIRAWSSFLAAVRLALERERDGRGAGLRLLTRTVTSPTLLQQIRDLLAAYPQREVGLLGARRPRQRRAGRGAGVRRGRGGPVRVRPGGGRRFSRRGFPGQRSRDAAGRPRLRLAAPRRRDGQPPLRRGVDAVSDGRQGGSPPAR